jgi:hypothetical protein
MTEYQRLFLVQARSNLDVFRLLLGQKDLPACHALHYLQMASEMLAKAHFWRHGSRDATHRAFAPFFQSLMTNRRAQSCLGFQGHNASWQDRIRTATSLAERVQNLAPSIAKDSPNPEYPWPRNAPTVAPAEHSFGIWQEIKTTPAGRKFLHLIDELFRLADQFL